MFFAEVGFGFVVSPLSVHLASHCSADHLTLLLAEVGVGFMVSPLSVHLVRHCSVAQLTLLFAEVGFEFMVSPLSVHLVHWGFVVVCSMLLLVCEGASERFARRLSLFMKDPVGDSSNFGGQHAIRWSTGEFLGVFCKIGCNVCVYCSLFSVFVEGILYR